MISDLFLQELKNNSDIEQVVSSYVRLRRRGRISTGLCPFHSEKSPSFTVYPDNQSFFCFGCGAGGDIITFIRRIENLEYVEAVKFLAERAGMAMPEDVGDDRAARLKVRVFELNRELAQVLFDRLENGQSVELTMLSAVLSIDQMGIAAELLNSISGMAFDPADADAYIETILSYREQKSQDEVAAMSDDDLMAYITSLASKKNRGTKN